MAEVNFMPFCEPRREKCGLCRQRLGLTFLLLLREGESVAGELSLCGKCALLLQKSFPGEKPAEMFVEQEEPS